NEECPQPQTREHLTALQIMGLKNIIIVQNKIDLVDEAKALKNYKQIKEFLKDTDYKDAPIIPISAQHGVNIDLLIEAIQENIPVPKRDSKKDPIMFIARSFDINKPGSKSCDIVGGVLGGSLQQGILKKGDEIEIRPGRKLMEHNQVIYKPILTKITAIKTGGIDVNEADPGGSIGVMTSLDPAIVKSDNLAGTLVGYPGTLPKVWQELNLDMHLLKRVVGSEKDLTVEPIKMMEPLMLNVNSSATIGVVTKLGKDGFACKLKLPVCAETGARVTISRQIGTRFRLIGYGIIKG
ncbi:MAG: translation initiation factor IF-2 subunit gamma, partial [Nanoarchaeota archaeon]|nr:translation initiation factor IF-2 subunit gamma [Nanoarchaeota archaeon]